MFKIRCAYLRHLLVTGVVILPVTAAAQPTIDFGALSDTRFDVTRPAASPSISLDIGGIAQEVVLRYQGPSGEIFNQYFYDENPFPAQVTLRGYLPYSPFTPSYENAFNLYTEPGTWTMVSATICSSLGANCSYYQGAQLQSIFSSLTLAITNRNRPDIKPPKLRSGNIVTQTVSIAHGPPLEIDIAAADNVSGLGTVAVAVCMGLICYDTTNIQPLEPMRKGSVATTFSFPANAQTGTYTVTRITLSDLAGSSIVISAQSQINAAFDGHTTFNVTP